MPARRIAAGWVLPVGGPLIERGAVLIDVRGKIVAVGDDASIPHPANVPADAFLDAILLPGLINTHTHLELTGLAGRVRDPDFAAWIRRLVQVKAERSQEATLAAARQGIADCWAAGVTTIADTGSSGAVVEALADVGGSGIAYHEVFGPHPDQCAGSLAALQNQVDGLSRFTGGRVRLGVSPHAPYTVSGPLYRAVAEWACEVGLPLATHIAESPAETDLLATGGGPFGDAWRARGIPSPAPLGCTPVEWLERHGVLGPRTLCIHAVQVGPRDVARLFRAGAAVAHCPLSNRAHAHGAAPLAALLEARLRVGLGTDSVVSVGELDLLAEARVARALASLSADAALALCTIDGARAIGWDDDIGTLEPGKWGDCVVLAPPAFTVSEHRAPVERALASGPRDVVATYLAGNPVYRQLRKP